MSQAPAKPKNKGGRPFAIVADEKTLKTIKGLGAIQATVRECAAVLDVNYKTFMAFLDQNPTVKDIFENGKAEGRASLRRTQFRLAEKNAGMAIFLGKNLLGQSDRQEISGPGGGPITTLDLSNATDEQLEALKSLVGPAAILSGGDTGGDQG